MKLLDNIEKSILFFSIVIFAIFVLPGFPVSFTIPKEILGIITLSLILIIRSIKSIVSKESKFFIGKFDLGVFLLTLVYILSGILRTPNKMEAFFYPGTVTFVIIASLFYFLINQLDKKSKNSVLVALFFSGILLSFSTLFTQLGIFAKMSFLPAFLKDSTFNPAGGYLPSLIYLATLLPIGIIKVIKDKDTVKRIFFGVASVIIILGGVVLTTNLLPKESSTPILPTTQTSWEVAVEALKTSPIWGVGAGNYLTAFNLYRPVSYNQTDLWSIRFSSASNYYFTVITELGFAGLLALVVLLVSIYKKFTQNIKQKSWEDLPVVLLLLLLAVFPIAPAIIFLLMILLSVFSSSEERSINIATTRIPTIILAVPVLLGIVALSIFGTKAVMAELTYKKSLDALTRNDAKGTYDLMILATKQNPYVDRYHASLAQVDMALATSIASKEDITDADRETITQLIQLAISEGKATVNLNPGRSGNWEVLAQIYRSIMSFAEGADQFTIQAYTQAVALDPINPSLRIALGGVYYALGNYDSAVDAFKMSALAKNDFANAHYNLAIAYREKKNYDAAITEINTVLNLVDVNSSDYTLAKTTLNDLEKNKPVTKATDTEGDLTTPNKQTTVVEPPITLPQDSTPPANLQ